MIILPNPLVLLNFRQELNNLILQRKNLRKRYRKEFIFDAKDIAVTSADEKFLNKAFKIIDEHISDYKFSVEEFAKEIGLSRMQLHRKITCSHRSICQ